MQTPVQFLLTRGLSFHKEGQPAAALACYQEVLAREPHNVDALHMIGTIAHESGDQEAAAELIELAIAHTPWDFTQALAEMQSNLAAVYRALGRFNDCERRLWTALQLDPTLLETRANQILHYDTQSNGPALLLRLRRDYSDQLDHTHLPLDHIQLDPDKRLTVGYLSGNYTLHSAAFSFQDIVTQHSDRFSVFLFSTNKKDDEYTRYFKENTSAMFVPCESWSDSELASYINDIGVDILVDLSGHTPGGRLQTFARKPAPIQITGWGYATGTGLPEMDYLFTDRIHLPPNRVKETISEQPLYLPAFMCHSHSAALPVLLPRIERAFTFGYYGNPRKLSTTCLAIWGDVLRAAPTARLILKYEGCELAYTQDWILKGLQIPRERVTFLGKTPHAAHLAAHAYIDVALDSWPHGGGVTTLEALLCGVPVITLAGDTLPSRTGAAILQVIDCDGWIADNRDEFIMMAGAWSRIISRYSRQEIRQAVLESPICDIPRYRDQVERSYRELWREYCDRQKPPRH